MSELPFDLTNPPDEPPAGVLQPMAWRLAVRLHRDHSPTIADPALPPVCRACGDPWPCHGRRIAERGLLAAGRPPRTSPPRPRSPRAGSSDQFGPPDADPGAPPDANSG